MGRPWVVLRTFTPPYKTTQENGALRPATPRQTAYRLAESTDAEGVARSRGFRFGRGDDQGRMVEDDGPIERPAALQDVP